MAKLLFQGHGSFRIVSGSGTVVYVDPFAGDGYDLPADLILVSHEHPDHNRTDLICLKEWGIILRAADLLAGGEYRMREVLDVKIKAVPACNKNHDIASCVGFLIYVDGKTIYAAGDTSRTEYMAEHMAEEYVDYALLPIDGRYNMDKEEAAECAAIIGARHAIPIHMTPGALFDEEMAASFPAERKLIVRPGEEIGL